MLVLVGFMGAGKSTVGRLVAERLGQPFVDSDVFLEQRERRTVREVFAQDGEPAFRDLEQRVIAELLAGPDAVLALGGGACGRAATRAALAGHTVVYLQVGFDEAMARIEGDAFRPMLHQPGVRDLHRDRLALYLEVATHVVDTGGRRAEAVALDILDRVFRSSAAGSGRAPAPAVDDGLLVATPGGSYRVHVGEGLVDHLARLLPALPDAERALVLADPHRPADDAAAARVAAQLTARGLDVHRGDVPRDPASRTLDVVGELAGVAADLALHRSDLVVAVGGEVTGDVAGFLAATYNRGMPLVLVPTTLEAQADSAVGGKASLDLPQGRHLLGVIHQPVVVVSDVALALADRGPEFRAGLAEAVKHALIADPALLPRLRESALAVLAGDPAALVELVRASAGTKAEVVTADERERGGRLHLNYGHTFAHALDHAGVRASDGSDAPLALGLAAAAHLAHRLGRLDAAGVAAHLDTLTAFGLPVRAEVYLEQLAPAWLRDKKYRRGRRFVLLDGLGRPEAGVAVEDADLRGALADLAGR